VLQERDAGTTGAFGRRVFIKGLAATDVAVGGPDPAQLRGFSSPDNLVFDRLGNL